MNTSVPAPAGSTGLFRLGLGRRIALGILISCLPGLLFGLCFARVQFFPGRAAPRGSPGDHGLATLDLKMQSADGLETRGWYIAPSRSPAPAMLVVHGYGGRRDRMLEVAAFLHRAGYGIAMMDLRQHGDSPDAAVTFGIREAQDVAPYLDFLASRPEHHGHDIGIIGCSLGAVTSLRLASLDPRVAAVVADSPFDSLSRQAWWRIQKEVPRALVPYCWFFTILAGALTTGVLPSEWEVGEWLVRIAPRPIMIIHGQADSSIPVEASRRLLEAAPGPVESWLVPGADHLDAMDDREAYAGRITDFLSRHVK